MLVRASELPKAGEEPICLCNDLDGVNMASPVPCVIVWVALAPISFKRCESSLLTRLIHDARLHGREHLRHQGSGLVPAFDNLVKSIVRREFDLVIVRSVCRLGRFLQNHVGLLGKLQACGDGLYSHTRAVDTTIRCGSMVFSMISVFSEFERAMIRDRVAGRARPHPRQGHWAQTLA